MSLPASSSTGESVSDRLTRQFYEWELWGRGWQVWEAPVQLEPPFYPFFGHFIETSSGPPIDDGRKPTFLSSLADRLLGAGSSKDQDSLVVHEEPERLPYAFDDEYPLVEIQLALPADQRIGREAMAQFLFGLYYVSRPLSFEVIGTSESVVVQITCSEYDRLPVRGQLSAYFPDAVLTEQSDLLSQLWTVMPEQSLVVDFGLAHEFMRPLRCVSAFDPDPLAGLVGSMSDLQPSENALFQVLFTPVVNPWLESILRAVSDGQGGSFFQDDKAMLSLASRKIVSPLLAAVIRVAATSPDQDRVPNIIRQVSTVLLQMSEPLSNELVPLPNEAYEHDLHLEDMLLRRSRRCGMLLNAEELMSIVHFPSASVRNEKLTREIRKTRAAPMIAAGHKLVLGLNEHAGKKMEVTLSPEHRVRHTHLIGSSGTGKSTLLLNMIVQDIQNGDGIAVLDPHGDLIDKVLGYVPEERIEDVILLDPSDDQYPVGFNILSTRSELEQNLLASDLVSVFRRLSTSWGDQMTSVLGNAILAFLESRDGGTLPDLRRFLVEKEYRERFLESVTDPEVVYYWRKEFPLLSGRPQAPILTRLDTFLRPKLIRYMISQKQDRLDFPEIMNRGKILLAKLSQGLIGEENSYLLGTLIVSRLNQTVMSRQEMDASKRKHFWLYVDEFHNFVTPSMAAILSGARKYNLGLVLAHQEMQQLQSRNADLASAVISNSHSRICFRLGDYDAKKLDDGFAHFTARDLQNLSVGEAICRMERAEFDFNLRTVPMDPVGATQARTRAEAVIASSRQRNAVAREEVENQSSPSAARGNQSEEVANSAPLPTVEKAASCPNTLSKKVKPDRDAQPPETSTPGRGGFQHKYLQQLIQRWAKDRGFKTAMEKTILDGLGAVDVAMEKGKLSVACEISVTTSAEHELANLQKCLAAGFTHVLSVSAEPKVLERVRAATWPELTEGQRKKVQFLTPEQVFSFLESLEVKTSATPVHGTKDLLTAKELEELLRIDVKTIYSYVQRGLIPYVKIQSNIRFVRSEVLAWLSEKQFKPKVKGGAARRE